MEISWKKNNFNISFEYLHQIFIYEIQKKYCLLFILNISIEYFNIWKKKIYYERLTTNIYIPVWSYSCKQEPFSESTVLPHSFTNSNNSAKERLRLYTKGHGCTVGRNKSLSHSCEGRFISLPIKKLIKQSYIAVMFLILPFNFLQETRSLIHYNNTVAICGN